MNADQPLDHAADPLRWRMYLVWPLLLACSYGNAIGRLGLLDRRPSDWLAPVLLGAAVLVSLIRWISERKPWFLILLALGSSLLCRELQLPGTS